MFWIILIFASLVIFVYFKVQQSRGTDPYERQRSSLKGNMAIGVFFISFGINSWLNLQSRPAAIIGAAFVIFGALNVIFGYRQFKRLELHRNGNVPEKTKHGSTE